MERRWWQTLSRLAAGVIGSEFTKGTPKRMRRLCIHIHMQSYVSNIEMFVHKDVLLVTDRCNDWMSNCFGRPKDPSSSMKCSAVQEAFWTGASSLLDWRVCGEMMMSPAWIIKNQWGVVSSIGFKECNAVNITSTSSFCDGTKASLFNIQWMTLPNCSLCLLVQTVLCHLCKWEVSCEEHGETLWDFYFHPSDFTSFICIEEETYLLSVKTCFFQSQSSQMSLCSVSSMHPNVEVPYWPSGEQALWPNSNERWGKTCWVGRAQPQTPIVAGLPCLGKLARQA